MKKKREVISEHMVKLGHSSISPFHQNNYPCRIELCGIRDEEETNIDEEIAILDEEIEFDKMLNEGLRGVWNKLMEDSSKLCMVLVKSFENNPSNY
jgi:hypothetical protein